MRSERVRQGDFGGGVAADSLRYWPASEPDVLQVLRRHRGQCLRVAGSRHSWSEVIDGADVTLDLGRLDGVTIGQGRAGHVRVGAGCTIAALLERLHAASERTLPTLGVITAQTIAGAISTGTHGSGMPGLSHYVTAVRAACYDERGDAVIREYREGDALRALRCAVGCGGVILELELETVPRYRIVETVRLVSRLPDVLAICAEWPLTQFIYIPYRWDFVAFARRRWDAPPRSALVTHLYRAYQLWLLDRGSHLALKLCLAFGDAATRLFLRLVPHALWKEGRRIDDAHRVLTMNHDFVRHEEMEVFVPASRLAEALAVLRRATEVCAGDAPIVASEVDALLATGGLAQSLAGLAGTYTHHYPFSIRKLPPEDTLISMGAGVAEPMFSISVFSYHRHARRGPYHAYCGWIARTCAALFGARLHWGKHFPLGVQEVERAYPPGALEAFRAACRANDAAGVFSNGFTERVLGIGRVPQAIGDGALMATINR